MNEAEAFAELRSLMNEDIEHDDKPTRVAWWRRARALARQARGVWRDEMREYSRGFPSHWAHPFSANSLKSLRPLAAAFPLAKFELDVAGESILWGSTFDDLLRCDFLDRITGLNLATNSLNDSHILRLVDALSGPTIESLDISNNHTTVETARLLASSPKLANLRVLSLQEREIDDDGLLLLADSTTLRKLEVLDLKRCDVSASAFQRLVSSEAMSTLRDLDLYSCGVGGDAARILSSASCKFTLERLGLTGCSIDDQGAAMLAASKHAESLVRLDLYENEVGDAGAEAIAKHMALEKLYLSGNNVGDRGVTAIANAPNMKNLRVLDLGACHVTAKGARALAASRYMANLEVLKLYLNRVGSNGAKAFATSSTLTSLRELSLGDNHIASAGVKAFLGSPMIAVLDYFSLHPSNLDPEVAKQIKFSRFLSEEQADSYWASCDTAELKKLAREYKIKGRSKMKRDQLLEAVRTHAATLAPDL